MNKTATATLCVTSFLLGAMLVAPNMAVGDPQGQGSTVISKFECSQADVREALRSLFKQTGASYNIATDVQGTVTISLQSVTLDTALENITRQADASYSVRNGVYQVFRKADPSAPEAIAPAQEAVKVATARPAVAPKAAEAMRAYAAKAPRAPQGMPGPMPVVVQDDGNLYILRGNNFTKVRKYDLTILKSLDLPMAGR